KPGAVILATAFDDPKNDGFVLTTTTIFRIIKGCSQNDSSWFHMQTVVEFVSGDEAFWQPSGNRVLPIHEANGKGVYWRMAGLGWRLRPEATYHIGVGRPWRFLDPCAYVPIPQHFITDKGVVCTMNGNK